MEKSLILKILCKKDAVDLDDSIYNLRVITDELRHIFMLSMNIDDDILLTDKKKLTAIYNILNPISSRLEDDNYIQGYTNSKSHLSKYINDICTNISKLISSMDSLNMKDIIYHTNILIDLVLSY